MKIRFYGDIHGNVRDMQFDIYHDLVEKSVQIGDYGIGFGQSIHWETMVKDLQADKSHRFIRGNHDDPQKVKEFPGYIKDGLYETIEDTSIMYVGGAYSVDKAYRTIGLDWWEDEELSSSEFYKLHNIYNIMKPDVMVTHDCPLSVALEMFEDSSTANNSWGPIKATRTGSALEAMLCVYKPKLWIFGHWHITKTAMIDGCKFICIGIDDYVDVDMKTLEVTSSER